MQILMLTVLGLVALGLYRWLNPGDIQQIRELLANAAEAASWSAHDGALQKLAGAGRLADLCTTDVEVGVDFGGFRLLRGVEQVKEAAAAARTSMTSFEVRLGEVVVELDQDGGGAGAQAVTTLRASGWTEPLVQEFRFRFRAVEGDWRIARVEPVQGFGQ